LYNIDYASKFQDTDARCDGALLFFGGFGMAVYENRH
jgi:hypothetical protein